MHDLPVSGWASEVSLYGMAALIDHSFILLAKVKPGWVVLIDWNAIYHRTSDTTNANHKCGLWTKDFQKLQATGQSRCDIWNGLRDRQRAYLSRFVDNQRTNFFFFVPNGQSFLKSERIGRTWGFRLAHMPKSRLSIELLLLRLRVFARELGHIDFRQTKMHLRETGNGDKAHTNRIVCESRTKRPFLNVLIVNAVCSVFDGWAMDARKRRPTPFTHPITLNHRARSRSPNTRSDRSVACWRTKTKVTVRLFVSARVTPMKCVMR